AFAHAWFAALAQFEPEADELVALLSAAVWMGASDVHLSPHDECVEVRLRVHGHVLALPRACWGGGGRSWIARLKALAHMQLGEQRRAQDGRIRLRVQGDWCDLRVAALPTIRGERIAVRVIPGRDPFVRLTDLGLDDAGQSRLRRQLQRGGLVVVAGRIGAGKSTTMRAIAREASADGRLVLTIEDPVERLLSDCAQVEVDERSGLDFAGALKAALRSDPDVIVVGEVRDADTAATAVRAGMTGHLVVTSVHADNAYQAVSRLLEFGVPTCHVRDALRAVLWQQLVAAPCPLCAGFGCSSCAGLGSIGRTGRFTLLCGDELEAACLHGGYAGPPVAALHVAVDGGSDPAASKRARVWRLARAH
ncbi:MAG: ATPase, T2SS/T4P/T4SS family, partial [Firmicutes bacterium]|nr:ATPase, T2SS/T4P/T4SS family [Bacillota bacterium]